MFMGVGSTGVAALSLNRRFIGIELDKTYYDASVKRIKKENKIIPLYKPNIDNSILIEM